MPGAQEQTSASAHPRAAIHIDLDGARHIFRAHGWTYEASEDPLFETGLRAALAVLAELKLTATLFVITEDLRHPSRRTLIEQALAAGHSVGSHTVTHRRLTNLDATARGEEVSRSFEQLSALGVEVRGFRAPGFGIDRDCLERIDGAGYAYDSSIVRTAEVPGLDAASGRPAHPHHPLAGRPLLELPIPVTGRHVPPFHPSYSLVVGSWYFRRGIRHWARERAPLTVLFHLTDFADPLPAKQLEGWQQRLFTLSYQEASGKRRRCAEMLEYAARYFTFSTTDQVLADAASTSSRTPSRN